MGRSLIRERERLSASYVGSYWELFLVHSLSLVFLPRFCEIEITLVFATLQHEPQQGEQGPWLEAQLGEACEDCSEVLGAVLERRATLSSSGRRGQDRTGPGCCLSSTQLCRSPSAWQHWSPARPRHKPHTRHMCLLVPESPSCHILEL